MMIYLFDILKLNESIFRAVMRDKISILLVHLEE